MNELICLLQALFAGQASPLGACTETSKGCCEQTVKLSSLHPVEKKTMEVNNEYVG